jgi:predicted nucleic acid-binding Zn ribbon protein
VSDELLPEPAPRAKPARSEPGGQNSSESGVESEPVEEAEHDKRGLELAKTLASRLKGAGPIQPVKKTRRRRPTGNQLSSARSDDRDPQTLTNTLGRLMRDQGWEVDVAVHGVMARWPSIVGPEMASHCQPESYTDTELTVRTDSTAWATQVRLLAPDLVRRLNAELGDGTVTRVKVEGPNAPSWRKGPRTVRGGRGPRDTYG